MVVLLENIETPKRKQKIVSSCSVCSVSFVTQDQITQHLRYHKSNECYNSWLQKLPSNYFEGEKLDLILEPSENDKFRPSNENSVSRSHIDNTWDEWDADAEKTVEKLEVLPSCTICGKEFLHQNTVDIHEMQHRNPQKVWKNDTASNDL